MHTLARPPPPLSQAAAQVWPEIFTSPAAEARKDELVEKMRAVRPVVETGCVLGGMRTRCAALGVELRSHAVVVRLQALACWPSAEHCSPQRDVPDKCYASCSYENIIQIRCLYEGVSVEVRGW